MKSYPVTYQKPRVGFVAAPIERKYICYAICILEKVKDNYNTDAKRAMKDTTYALLKIKNLKTNYDVPKFKTFKINIEKLLNVQEYDWGYPIEESTT